MSKHHAKGITGKQLRWARNEIKKFEQQFWSKTRGHMSSLENEIWDEGVLRKRYERAAALLVEWALLKD